MNADEFNALLDEYRLVWRRIADLSMPFKLAERRYKLIPGTSAEGMQSVEGSLEALLSREREIRKELMLEAESGPN